MGFIWLKIKNYGIQEASTPLPYFFFLIYLFWYTDTIKTKLRNVTSTVLLYGARNLDFKEKDENFLQHSKKRGSTEN